MLLDPPSLNEIRIDLHYPNVYIAVLGGGGGGGGGPVTPAPGSGPVLLASFLQGGGAT